MPGKNPSRTPVPNHATIALCMIAKNEAGYLEDCIQSVRPLANRIVVVDTGSTDATRDIAARLGAEVHSRPWENDFSAARNASLKLAREDWILVLDADERLDVEAHEPIRRAATQTSADAYLLRLRNYFYQPNQAIWDQPCSYNPTGYSSRYPARYYCEHQGIRFFRNHGRYSFTGRLHERVATSGGEFPESATPLNVTIHHLGFLKDKTLSADKDALYLQMAELQCREQPLQSDNYLILGMERLQRQGPSRACLEAFVECQRISPHEPRAWIFAGVVCNRLRLFGEAENYLSVAATLSPRNALLWEERGDACFNKKDYAAASNCYGQADVLRPTARLALKRAVVAGKLEQPALPLLRRVVTRLPQAGSGSESITHVLEFHRTCADSEPNSVGESALRRILAQVAQEQGRQDLVELLTLL